MSALAANADHLRALKTLLDDDVIDEYEFKEEKATSWHVRYTISRRSLTALVVLWLRMAPRMLASSCKDWQSFLIASMMPNEIPCPA